HRWPGLRPSRTRRIHQRRGPSRPHECPVDGYCGRRSPWPNLYEPNEEHKRVAESAQPPWVKSVEVAVVFDSGSSTRDVRQPNICADASSQRSSIRCYPPKKCRALSSPPNRRLPPKVLQPPYSWRRSLLASRSYHVLLSSYCLKS